ncbi:hypothetical protein LOC67_23575 [Stieleria sp. JC731]|uniref:hypothetical protein n=1 Tax=Pirellulaceae TaxID=2691357 RepID=UPI001E4885A9|nr:hypothetical protein [Stieleria sp. JC731]MCC9603541.1 hypothetical protein [Stieleria sp. JC731]
MRLVSVLCVSPTSNYKLIDGVDVFDAERDCMTFDGSTPIVAHPPCRAWSAFCRHQAKPDPGEKELAPWCVEQLRHCGGVLEHPAYSKLWDELDLPKPNEPPRDGLWSMWVNQSWWGDRRIKNTWLLVSGRDPRAVETPLSLHGGVCSTAAWNSMSKHNRASTPLAMAQWLVDQARQTTLNPEELLCAN